ncbi:histidine kinase dimerization/phosphoacceptor domain-containing protein [Actinomycetospora endophytica]|uniref:Histidine kinase dimerization/phosphoacceptor domain-containing protein n=1 Tax=Actinomycetospora endophytica TaxID=2291215 RepID=A0ABS8PDX0_9PSEU|nr:histidine kinase [Actinomycetospora endophytica]MCD2196183.1 histidine kinase dimerization/phosphoacceptor domain-containing protein [Actinomycetospora endophytica]
MTRGSVPRTYAPTPGSGAGVREHWMQRLELERELHDGASLRLSALSVRLGVARHQLSAHDLAVENLIDEVHEELVAALHELRRLGSKLYPPVLHASGLAVAIGDVAVAMRLPVEVVGGAQRFGPASEGVAYSALVTCLPIVCRAGARVAVDIGGADGELSVRLSGGSRGLDPDLAVEAVDAMSEAVAAAGGSCEMVRRPATEEGDSMIVVMLPCE